MKKHLLIAAILLGGLAVPGYAQLGLSVNISTQPVWGPVGYDHADYYYIPDINAYYDVPTHEYTWYEHGRWITDNVLPPQYANFDFYHAYKAVINEPSPWLHNDRYRRQYAHFRGTHDQPIIRDSHEERYYANPGHPEHRAWKQQHAAGHGEGMHEDHRDDRRGEGRGNYRGEHR